MTDHRASLWLKPERDVHSRNRHHAIFRAAIEKSPKAADGSIVEVRSHEGEFLGFATWNSKAYISGRMISFEKGDPLAHIKSRIESALRLRAEFMKDGDTNAFRLINAEGDGIPGLIVDRYGDVLVLQLTTLGMDVLREWITDTLMELLHPTAIFEKSSGSARKKEGLHPREGWLRGSSNARFHVRERDLLYIIELFGSQKTGLFLDQREERSLVRSLAKDRTVLDVCSYVGGFALSALAGGAKTADAVDYDAAALERAKEHMSLNGIGADRFSTITADAFDFLRRRPPARPYDFIILDPPAFAKRSQDLEPAKKAYTDLNRMAMEILPAGSLLLTCSCSYQMGGELFQQAVFHAARSSRRSVRILQRHRNAIDHPINLYHPETEYLKSLLLYVE